MTAIPVYFDEAPFAEVSTLTAGGQPWTFLIPGWRMDTPRVLSEPHSGMRAPTFRLFLSTKELDSLGERQPHPPSILQWDIPKNQRLLPLAWRGVEVLLGVTSGFIDRGVSGRGKAKLSLLVQRIIKANDSEAIAAWVREWVDLGAFSPAERKHAQPEAVYELPRNAAFVDDEPPKTILPVSNERTEPPPPSGEVTVWFGTNRQPLMDNGQVVGFGGNFDDALHTGTYVVTVDNAKPIGGFQIGILAKIFGGARTGIRLGELTVLECDTFWALIAEAMRGQAKGRRSAMIFVHGYLNTFVDSIKTAAALAADVGGWSLTAAFSWPSAGEALGYLLDGEMCAASEIAFEGFVRDFVTRSGAEDLHIIAHSMGNRLLVRTMERLHRQPLPDGAVLRNLVFAAPDVERTLFRHLVPLCPGTPCRRTLYASPRDKALQTSREWVNRTDRAGLSPPVTVCDSVDTIDVGEVDLSDNGHRAFREAPKVIEDLFYLTRHGFGPSERHGLKATAEAGVSYWKFQKQRPG